MSDAMRSHFRAKHINDDILMEDLVKSVTSLLRNIRKHNVIMGKDQRENEQIR
jgi:hypothetical protein